MSKPCGFEQSWWDDGDPCKRPATHRGVYYRLADKAEEVIREHCEMHVLVTNGHWILKSWEQFAPTEAERALAVARSVLWMAKEYAQSGGSSGPEMRDYETAMTALKNYDAIRTKKKE